jgi:flavin reductase (DIM6/NTAB) family NADH-FMN oxidoreductase RutF
MEVSMHVFQPVEPSDVDDGPFTFKGTKMLITVAKGDKVNTTAASWGGVGYLWDRRIVFIFLPGKRYTKEFLDETKEFSISFLNQTEYRGALKYLEAVSGRTEDKIAGARLTVNYDDGIPFIDEADNVITAKVLFKKEFGEEGFVDRSLLEEFYKTGDYHYVYVGVIKKIMIR